MNEAYLVDFYRGWLIEVSHVEGNFRSVCYSPCREIFSTPNPYDSDIAAMRAAEQIINQHTACHALIQLLRELYEMNKLNFEDWRSLQQSLTKFMKTV